MLSERLKTFLDREGVAYDVIKTMEERFTAQELAASLHLSGKKLAKVVMVKVGGRLVMAVLPAHEQVILSDLAHALGDREEVRLAREDEFISNFPDCRTGTMPPFGNLYGVPVYVDDRLAIQDEIYFEGGSYSEIVKMKYDDYVRLVKPITAKFGKVSKAA